MQDREHTFTLHIQSGKVSITGPFAHIRRAKDIADLISRFSETLPHDMSMTFIMDDQPAVMLEHERKTRMLEVAAQGECTSLLLDIKQSLIFEQTSGRLTMSKKTMPILPIMLALVLPTRL